MFQTFSAIYRVTSGTLQIACRPSMCISMSTSMERASFVFLFCFPLLIQQLQRHSRLQSGQGNWANSVSSLSDDILHYKYFSWIQRVAQETQVKLGVLHCVYHIYVLSSISFRNKRSIRTLVRMSAGPTGQSYTAQDSGRAHFNSRKTTPPSNSCKQ